MDMQKDMKTEYLPVDVLKALSDETRLRIVLRLGQSGRELCACDLLEKFAISQPTLSYHIRILTACGLVVARKDGAWMRYTLDASAICALQEFFQHLSRSGVVK